MKTFVFSTNRNRLTESPLNIKEKQLHGFGNNQNDILILDSNRKSHTINTNVEIEELDVSPYYVLVKDLQLPNQSEDGLEVGICYILETILRNSDEIYLIIHKGNPSNFYETFKRIYSERLKSWIYHNHIEDSIYYRFLRKVLMEQHPFDIAQLEDDILKKFPDPVLEASIDLWKKVTMIGIKYEHGVMTSEDVNKSIFNVNNEYQKEVIPKTSKIILTGLAKLEYVNEKEWERNFNLSIEELYKSLFPKVAE